MRTLSKAILILFFSGIISINGLYEDQIAKFDWRQQYIGKVTHALFDKGFAGKRIVVGTEQNVIAALNAGSGKLLWRHITGSGSKGKLHSLLPVDNGKIAVISGNPITVRAFEPSTGLLLWENALTKEYQSSIFMGWSTIDGSILSAEILKSSTGYQLVETHYDSNSGIESSSETVDIPWFTHGDQCDFANSYLACVDSRSENLNIMKVHETHSHQKISLAKFDLQKPVTTGVVKSYGSASFVWLKSDKFLVFKVTKDGFSLIKNLPDSIQAVDAAIYSDGDQNKQYLSYVALDNGIYNMGVYNVDTEELSEDLSGPMKFPEHFASPSMLSVFLSKKQQGDIAQRYLLSTEDHGLVYGNRKEVYWTREESLASIIKVEMVDLPVSATDVSIEEEFTSDDGAIGTRIVKRLTSQLWQLAIITREIANRVRGSVGSETIDTSVTPENLVRDRFGLHKLILVITKPGKIFTLDTLTGKIVWQRLLRGISTEKLTLFVQRTSIHYPLEPQCVILAKDAAGTSVLIVFNPVTGQPVGENDGYIHLGYTVQQALLIPQNEETEFLKPLLMLDDRDQPHVYPATESTHNRIVKMADNLFLFTADPKTCVMRGFSLAPSRKHVSLSAVQVWQLNLCSAPPSADNEESAYREEIGSIVGRHPEEKVFSQGRVLADRSVLYKYLNPNLVVVTTEGWHPHHRGYLNVYLVDVVSGSVVFSMSHRRILGPVHVVHAENWVVYSYYNERQRRTELASLELFEGKDQSNSSAFSSFTAPQPLVDRQAYIYPSYIVAMKDTFSEKGMTAKHILLGLANGWVQELPRVFLDPRRPVVAAATPEMREEGVMPYLPELPIQPEAIVNYNQTVQSVRGIYTTNSALESTGLVFVYGLDLFFTHVTPSRTFDVLNDDFEYFFIAAVLIGLTLASFITRRLASKKALRQAWK